MCTISIVPIKDGLVCTFNRDEQISRQTDEYICQEHHPSRQVFFSRDKLSGGTWFCADDQGQIAMLFNGGFGNHEKQKSYRKSRGKVLLELMTAAIPLGYFHESEFSGIEPFSVILASIKSVSRLTWDGSQKHITLLDNSRPHFFSSATLYAPSCITERENWFNSFTAGSISAITPESIFSFHRNHKDEDHENGLVIKRASGIATLSISQATLSPGTTRLVHLDLFSDTFHHAEISQV